MGRKKLEIDEKQVEQLAAIMCTMEEIASVVECSVDTLERRFADVIKRGREKGKSSLRRRQFELCKRNATMCIWLGKQYLGQSDKLEQMIETRLTMEQREQMLADAYGLTDFAVSDN